MQFLSLHIPSSLRFHLIFAWSWISHSPRSTINELLQLVNYWIEKYLNDIPYMVDHHHYHNHQSNNQVSSYVPDQLFLNVSIAWECLSVCKWSSKSVTEIYSLLFPLSYASFASYGNMYDCYRIRYLTHLCCYHNISTILSFGLHQVLIDLGISTSLRVI